MLLDIHESWAWSVVVGNALAGIWCTSAHWLPALRARAMWWFVVAVELTVFVQVGLGVAMVAGQGLKAPKFHMFYGFVAIIAIGIIYAYRSQMEKWTYLLYGLGSFFIMGLGIRAMIVGAR